MKAISMLFAVLLSLLITPALAGPEVVVTNGSSFRIVFSDLGTVLSLTCPDDPDAMICGNAFSICTNQGLVIDDGSISQGLGPGSLEFIVYYKPGTTNAVPLVQNGIDGVTGAPRYDLGQQVPAIPDGTKIYLVFNNHPSGTNVIGVHSFFELTKGKCGVCVRRKVYNQGPTSVKLFRFKEFYHFCPARAVFDVNNGVAQGFLEDDTELCHVFVSTSGNVGATSIKAGSVESGHLTDELNGCALSSYFRSDQVVGDRWLGLFFDFYPGYVCLSPVGKSGYEKFFPVCVEIHCERKPPGTPCPPDPCTD